MAFIEGGGQTSYMIYVYYLYYTYISTQIIPNLRFNYNDIKLRKMLYGKGDCPIQLPLRTPLSTTIS
jgi:hypothetical protein